MSLENKNLLVVTPDAIEYAQAEKLADQLTLKHAKSGLEALTSFELHHYDVLLVSDTLDDISAGELISEIRSMPYWDKKNVGIIGFGQPSSEATLKKAGANDFVTLPFTDNLSDTILNLLEDNKNAESTEKGLSFDRYVEMADGDHNFLIDIIDKNLTYFDELTRGLMEMIEKKDFDKMHFYHHKTKPLFMMLEVSEYQQQLKEIIDMAEKNIGNVEDKASLWLQDIGAVVAFLKDQRSKYS